MFMVVQKNSQLLMPSDVSTRVGFLDRFAGRAALFASRAPFFAFCVLLVALWLLGLVTSYTLGGLLHILLVIAVVLFLVHIVQGSSIGEA